METVITAALDDLAPVRCRRRRQSKPVSRWLSRDAVDAKRRRRQLERRWLRTRDEKDRVAYRRACRSANATINEARRAHFSDQLSKATNSTERWRTVKTLLHSNQNKSLLSDTECDSLRNSFSQFFTDKISDIKQAVARDPNPCSIPPSPELINAGPVLVDLAPVTPAEVLKIINTVPPKSSRLDYVPTSLIKSCSFVFADLISGLANRTFTQGCFPGKFKSAVVKPLLKKPGLDVNSPSNYRPISNLNNISKILERLFLSRLNSHVIKSPHFSHLQSA